jgi:predicted hydrocarbon binding protein
MKTINKTQLNLISGGNPAAAAAGVAVAVTTGTAAVIEAGKTFVELGHDIGEALYNKNHGNDNLLGKMEFTKDDFKQPNWYLPAHQHPNNMHGNNFHNSFGNF